MSLRSKITLIFICLFFSVNGQKNQYPIISKIDADSVIIFTVEQGKELVKINEQRKEALELNEILKKQLIQKDTIITSQSQKIENYKKIVKEKDNIINQKDELIKLSDEEKKNLKKEVNKQKTGKWFAIIGCVVIGVLGVVF